MVRVGKGTPRLSIAVLLGLGMLVLWLGTYGAAQAQGQQPPAGARVTGATLARTEPGSDLPFTVQIDQDNKPFYLAVDGQVNEGDLRVRMADEQGATAWEMTVDGKFDVMTKVQPPKPGVYHLGLAWSGPVRAQYNLEWNPQPINRPTVKIQPTALLPGLGMLLVGVGFVVYAGLRRLHWGYLVLGAVGWAITVAMKFAWAIPINPPVYRALTAALPGLPGQLVMALYIGLLTGVFEVGVAWLVLRYSPLGRVTWRKALAFGIGWGAIEAILLAISPLVTVIMALAMAKNTPAQVLEQAQAFNNVAQGLAPVVERFFTIWIHILANVLMFYAIAMRRPRYFWLGFAFKSLIDMVAGYAQLVGISGLTMIWELEAIVAVFGIAGWLGTRWVAARYPEPAVMQSAPQVSASDMRLGAA